MSHSTAPLNSYYCLDSVQAHPPSWRTTYVAADLTRSNLGAEFGKQLDVAAREIASATRPRLSPSPEKCGIRVQIFGPVMPQCKSDFGQYMPKGNNCCQKATKPPSALSALTPPVNLRLPLRVRCFAALQVAEQVLQQRSNVF